MFLLNRKLQSEVKKYIATLRIKHVLIVMFCNRCLHFNQLVSLYFLYCTGDYDR